MFKSKEVIHIVAVDENMGIGKDGKLLYSIPNDLKYFRDTTLGHSLLCGRKTYESFPKPLDRRIVQCITRNGGGSSYGTLIDGLYDAEHNSHLLNTDKIFIVGGASLYEQTADIVDTLLIKRESLRGEHLIGVSWSNTNKVFMARVHKNKGKQEYLGCFKTELEAFNAYKVAKEAFVKEQAEKWKGKIDDKAYNALMNYEVEITD